MRTTVILQNKCEFLPAVSPYSVKPNFKFFESKYV